MVLHGFQNKELLVVVAFFSFVQYNTKIFLAPIKIINVPNESTKNERMFNSYPVKCAE